MPRGFIFKEGVGLADHFRETYPDLEFETVDSAREGLKLVQNRNLFAFVDTIPSIAYAVKDNNYYNIKVSGKLEETLQISMDVDHFKSINDRFGHQTGDEVLKKIGALIKKSIRSSDIPGRWGGEEFLIICPETDRQGAQTLAEEIRKDIQAVSFLSDTTITISGGVAEYELKEDSEKLLKRADDNLYKAKHSGRNRICA